MAIARLDKHGAIDLGLVGNAAAFVCGRHATRRHTGHSSVLGSRSFKHGRLEQDSRSRGEVLVLFSDGLSSHVSLEGEDTLLHEHPILIAERMMERYGTHRDDAMVVVVA